jgi:hypothetical protein
VKVFTLVLAYHIEGVRHFNQFSVLSEEKQPTSKELLAEVTLL